MGNTFSDTRYRVADPKTPYEYSKKDAFLTDEKELDKIMDDIKDQLEADARYIEQFLTGEKGQVHLYQRNILRVSLLPNKFTATHAVLSRDLRVKCLKKYLNVPFTISNIAVDGITETIISYVHIPSKQNVDLDP